MAPARWRPPRTSHHADPGASAIAAAVAERGATVDVVVPARDEAPTVGGVVRAVLPLVAAGVVHDLVVVDSRSSDGTAAVARDAGARVVHQDEVVAGVAAGSGKGAAMWAGLAATQGDLVVFLDADLREVRPHFVHGLLGPLLADEHVQLVKGFYDRPVVAAADGRPPGGGGRVTELMARPVVNAWWPELAWVAQPLGGEYAARRRVLEQLSLVEGYGVELAMLVEVARAHGVEALAQVDLGVRHHRHQGLGDLGRMAAHLLAVAADCLAAEGRSLPPPAPTLWQPDTGRERLELAGTDIEVRRRPPLSALTS